MLFLFAILSFVGHSLFYRANLPKQFQDVPNHRSMHEKPVKKSAGIVFVGIFLALLTIQFFSNELRKEDYLFILIGTSFFCILGFIDDLIHLSSVLKLVLEIIFLAVLLNFFPQRIHFFGLEIYFPIGVSILLLILFIVFTTNLCNFMDGLDSYLSGSFLAFTINLIFLTGLESQTSLILISMLISMTGFFYFNLPNAKMFMGDSGSLSIGFLISTSLFLLKDIGSENSIKGTVFVIPFLIPIFFLDGIVTIVKRTIQKQNVFLAHKEHLYQRIQTEVLTKVQTIVLFIGLNFIPLIVFIGIHYFGTSLIIGFSIILILEVFIYSFLDSLT
ncbi:MAG: hypothetical protein SFU98_20650 [Leptospiraceae bacterium]|nr:hypothetical protein [Leptospiraceae bacterium]